MAGVFITGTGTDVGKTAFSKALYSYLKHEKGLRVAYMKPVQTGVGDEDHLCDYLCVTGGAGSPVETPLNTPYSFARGVSPHLASRLDSTPENTPENTHTAAAEPVSLAHIKGCYDRLSHDHDIVLVEGAGGACSPITGNTLNMHLIAHLNLPAIVVMANKLGAIHQSIATITALANCSLHGAGARGDAPRGDAPRGDAPRGDAPRGDAPRGDAPRGDASRGDASWGVEVLGFVANVFTHDVSINANANASIDNRMLQDNINTIEHFTNTPCLAHLRAENGSRGSFTLTHHQGLQRVVAGIVATGCGK